jgi:hypothetical protein
VHVADLLDPFEADVRALRVGARARRAVAVGRGRPGVGQLEERHQRQRPARPPAHLHAGGAVHPAEADVPHAVGEFHVGGHGEVVAAHREADDARDVDRLVVPISSRSINPGGSGRGGSAAWAAGAAGREHPGEEPAQDDEAAEAGGVARADAKAATAGGRHAGIVAPPAGPRQPPLRRPAHRGRRAPAAALSVGPPSARLRRGDAARERRPRGADERAEAAGARPHDRPAERLDRMGPAARPGVHESRRPAGRVAQRVARLDRPGGVRAKCRQLGPPRPVQPQRHARPDQRRGECLLVGRHDQAPDEQRHVERFGRDARLPRLLHQPRFGSAATQNGSRRIAARSFSQSRR